MNEKEIARILGTITEEQWEAILSASEHVNSLPIMKGVSKVDGEGKNDEENKLRLEAESVIRKIGVPPNILGYVYLQDAIMLACEDKTYINNVVKRLYVDIAKKHNSTGARVERSIRHALGAAYRKGKTKLFEVLFGERDMPPTNAYAIATMAEYIKRHN